MQSGADEDVLVCLCGPAANGVVRSSFLVDLLKSGAEICCCVTVDFPHCCLSCFIDCCFVSRCSYPGSIWTQEPVSPALWPVCSSL
jgi:hypothetical protein